MNTSVLLLGLVLLASYLDETIAFGIAHHTAPPPQPGVVSTATPFQHYSLQNRPTSGSNTAKDYIYLWLLAPDTRMNVQEQRQEQQQQQPLQVASQAQVKQALQNPKTVLLDARTDEEIIQQGFLSVKGHRWVHASCTKDDCPLLLKTAESQLPDKDSK